MQLIILNGPCGVGKSTIAGLLHAEMDRSLLIQPDALRRLMSGYRAHFEESRDVRDHMTFALLDVAVNDGCPAIVEQIYHAEHYLETLRAMAESKGYEVFEYILWAEWETVWTRSQERPQRPNSLLTPELIREKWEQIGELKEKRGQARIIRTDGLDAGKVAMKILEDISH